MMERLYRPDQDILDELDVGMSVSEVVHLPTSEYAARLRHLNLSPQAAALVKCLRRRIKNRTLQERGDATPLPTETARAPVTPLHSAPRHNHSPGNTDKFTCDLHSLVAKSIHHMYRYEYDKDDADNLLDFRKQGDLAQRKPKGNFTDPSVEDNIRNEREEVAKALQLLAMTQPKTELDTNINVFQNGYSLKAENFDLIEKPNIHSRDEATLKSKPTFYGDHSFYGEECENRLREKREPVRVRAKCVQIECEREDTMKDEGAERRRKRRKERGGQRSCIVHTSDVRAVEQEIQNVRHERFLNADDLFYSEDYLKSEVLNLSLKANGNERRHHGRKQQAPRRIKYAGIEEDIVLDLKIKKSYE